MNTVLILVLLIMVMFALKEGQIWIALGVGLMMVLIGTAEEGGMKVNNTKQFLPQSPEISGSKEQMLRVKYQPGWDGNTWWEEMPEHWGSGIGRLAGLLR